MPAPALTPLASGVRSHQPTVAELDAVAALLTPLARKGAHLVMDGGTGLLMSPRNCFAEPIRRIEPAALARVHDLKWLTTRPDRTAVLSRAGLIAVRAVLTRAASEAAATALPAPRAPAASAGKTAGPALPASNPDESPLAWLRRRKDKDGRPLITEPEFEAGERLRAEFHLAQMTPRVTANWSPAARSRNERRSTPGHGIELADNVVAARQRVGTALAAVGPELAGILIDVCCHMQGIEQAERASGLPQRSGKIVLQLALRSLARHYGLIRPDGGPWSAREGIRHWGAPGYRPSLDSWTR